MPLCPFVSAFALVSNCNYSGNDTKRERERGRQRKDSLIKETIQKKEGGEREAEKGSIIAF